MGLTIRHEVIKKCLEFSKESAKTQSGKDFGEDNGATRTTEQISFANLIGKLGEEAVKQFLADRGIDIELDYNIYPRGQYDDNDIIFKGWMIDVKGTKKQGKNFLIEFNKLAFRYDEGKLPHYFIMTRVGLDEKEIKDILDGNVPESCQVELAGFISTLELQENNSDIRIIKKGEGLCGLNNPLKATNFCVPFEKLDQDWDKLISRMMNESPFDLKSYQVPGVYKKNNTAKKNEPLFSGAKYSILIAGREAISFSREKIRAGIEQGIKFFVFLPKDNYLDFAEFADRKREEITVFQLDNQADISLKIIDGEMSDQQKKDFARLCQMKTSPVFNYEQYEVEHHNTSDMLIVKASAGTGKTTVMVDRIMYLLATVDNIIPGDIGMITFTNKATASMIEKLQKRIQEMYQRTKSSRWYNILEQISDMQISTIDSFFKNIVSSAGSLLGYGSKAKIRSFRDEKKKIIQDIINEQFVADSPSSILKRNIISTAYYVKIAMKSWDELHRQGIFRETLYSLDFGEADRESGTINENLRNIVMEAERRYQKLKQKENSYMISDIKAETDELAQRDVDNMREISFKYMFVDEFQDTDNSQINSIVWLVTHLNCQLFVVGDVKQSIYRFRGAEESAFDELKTRLMAKGMPGRIITEKYLTKNYRTSYHIIEKLNTLFNSWADEGLLVNYQNARACVDTEGKIFRITYSKYTRNDNLDIRVREELKKLQKTSKHICMLSRSNNGVKRFASICREADIFCFAKVDGGFYKYRAVLDFYALLGSLLYPESPIHLYNVLVSPYTSAVPDMERIASLDGDKEKLTAYFHELLAQDGWQTYTTSIRYETAFKLIENILSRQNPVSRYAQMWEAGFDIYKDSNIKEYDVRTYELNLNKLLQLIYDRYTGDFVSLSNIYDFLDISIQTNSSEDMIYPEPVAEKDECIVEAMTVHKAKGLEFETVLIPYMNRPFFQNEDKNEYFRLIADNSLSPIKVSWRYRHKEKEYLNEYYKAMRDIDDEAARREEVRILYVALTRAMNKVVLFIPDDPSNDTWGEFLKYFKGDAE